MSDYLKFQVIYSKQPNLGLKQEFVVVCAHALWVVIAITKILVFLMLVNGFPINILFYFYIFVFILGWYIECQLNILSRFS